MTTTPDSAPLRLTVFSGAVHGRVMKRTEDGRVWIQCNDGLFAAALPYEVAAFERAAAQHRADPTSGQR